MAPAIKLRFLTQKFLLYFNRNMSRVFTGHIDRINKVLTDRDKAARRYL